MKRFFLSLLVCFFFTACFNALIAGETKTYYSSLSAPIRNKDIVFARTSVIFDLRRSLLEKAIADLINPVILEENHYLIYRSKPLNPAKYISSIKVLKEKVEGKHFYMEMQGTIQLDSLKEKLREKGLILLDDPWMDVSWVLGQNIVLPQNKIDERLAIFHIRLKPQQIDTNQILTDFGNEKAFARELFSRFPENPIIFFVDTREMEDSALIKGLDFQIFRKSDFALVDHFFLTFSSPTTPPELKRAIQRNLPRLLSLFSLKTLDIDTYEVGEEFSISLSVSGLVTPYQRFMFESWILKPNRLIQSFKILGISKENAQYQLFSVSSLSNLKQRLQKTNPYFDIIPIETDPPVNDKLAVRATPKLEPNILQMRSWNPENNVIKMIKETLAIQNEEELESYIPSVIEEEPNNDSQHIDQLVPDILMLGKISSRVDNDVFMLTTPELKSKLKIKWIQVGKTDLSPLLKLYDKDFNYLNSYFLAGNQNQLEIDYEPISDDPQTLFVLITDRIGFVAGETGGFKSFYYLLRYEWEKD
ncbi:MAG: hypothetical protein OEY59_00135 [Deltaproteobacteria bacterium]|nr:hypothetical protein [Deltaproteobacteria bacterium]